jgi:transcriptional regulator with XRE-family HTH domain
VRNWLKAIRNEKGLSQRDLSKMMGISQAHLCEIEKGTRHKDMTYSMMEKIAEALGVPVQEIIDAEKGNIT